MTRTLLCSLGVLAAAVLAGCGVDDSNEEGTAPATGTDAESEVVFPGNCTTALKPEPASVVVTCADSGVSVVNIQWQAWGADTATGNGTAHVNDCDPDCVAGEISTYDEAHVKLTTIQSCDSGEQYTRLELSFEGEAPKGLEKPLRESFPCD